MSGDLVKRLRWGFLKKGDGTNYPVNPDGPEAAARIEALEAALRFYADPGVYMPDSVGRVGDLTFVAKNVLAEVPAQAVTATEGTGTDA